jgi:type I restriction enzyme S subunit
VLVSSRAPIGYTSRNLVPMAFNQGCKAAIPLAGHDARFMQYALISSTESMQAAGSGSTFLELSSEAFASLPMAVVELGEQRRIADFLDDRVARIDRIITARMAQRSKLEDMSRTHLARHLLFGDEFMPLRYLIVDERLGLWGSEVGEEDVDVRVARVSDFERDEFRLGEVPTIRSAGAAQVSSRELRHGDVLLERSGGTQVNPVGCAVYVEEPERLTVCSNFVSRLRPADSTDGRYLSLLMGALYATGQQRPHSNQTTGIQNLDTTSYFQTRVPKRPLSEQRRLGLAVDGELASTRKRQDDLRESVHRLSEYKQSLITAAVTGDLDVTTAGSGIPS